MQTTRALEPDTYHTEGSVHNNRRCKYDCTAGRPATEPDAAGHPAGSAPPLLIGRLETLHQVIGLFNQL